MDIDGRMKWFNLREHSACCGKKSRTTVLCSTEELNLTGKGGKGMQGKGSWFFTASVACVENGDTGAQISHGEITVSIFFKLDMCSISVWCRIST